MKEIKFSKNGSSLKVKFNFYGLIAAAYIYKLGEKNSNQAVQNYTGDNLNPEDDEYDLPDPASVNDSRIIMLSTEFYGLDPNNYKEYNIEIQVFQGSKLIGDSNDKGDITGNTQSSLMFIKLIGE